jgi:hypothetical protein
MAKYRKKPIEIEAFCPSANGEWPEWATQALNKTIVNHGDKLLIFTLEGRMTAEPYDWIIRGVKGEIYPCKPDIFAASYDLA